MVKRAQEVAKFYSCQKKKGRKQDAIECNRGLFLKEGWRKGRIHVASEWEKKEDVDIWVKPKKLTNLSLMGGGKELLGKVTSVG